MNDIDYIDQGLQRLSEKESSLEEEFINAIINQNIYQAKKLLLYDLNINYRNLYGQTLLILSVNCDFIEIVVLLLDNGADVNLFDNLEIKAGFQSN